MKILMVTPRVNSKDPIFGFTVSWIKELANHLEQLNIITLGQSTEVLPSNVKVYSILGNNKLSKLLNLEKLYFRLIPKNDIIFTHMYNEFAILSWLPAKIQGKPILVWYAHSNVNLKLFLTNMIADKLVSSNKNAFRIKSKKVKFIGQGVNIEIFKPKPKKKSNYFQLVTAGRISLVKNLEFLIIGVNELIKLGYKIKFIIVGSPAVEKDKEYLIFLEKIVKSLGLRDIVDFKEHVSQEQLSNIYNNSDFYIHACESGLDKTTLEAMSCGIPVISCNTALKEILNDYPELIYKNKDLDNFKKNLNSLLKMSIIKRNKLGKNLSLMVRKNHSVNNIVEKLLAIFDTLV